MHSIVFQLQKKEVDLIIRIIDGLRNLQAIAAAVEKEKTKENDDKHNESEIDNDKSENSRQLSNISEYTLNHFNEALENKITIHDIDIARWAFKAQEKAQEKYARIQSVKNMGKKIQKST